MKQVYVSLIADLLHAGHINILNEAAGLGKVTAGLLTLKACGELNDVPYLSYENRKAVLEQLRSVDRVIPQHTASYHDNLMELQPDYVVHGDDWLHTWQKKYRDEVIHLLNGWQGKLVEVPYNTDINDLQLNRQINRLGITSSARQARLRTLLEAKPVISILEAHNAISGLIAENASVTDTQGQPQSFDGIWSSSLTDSTAKGKPDIEAVDTTSRLTTVNEIFEVTTKPLIYDADTGGRTEHFEFTVRTLERTGVSAVIIEDKTGLKRNSLFGNDVSQQQADIEHFCHKIRCGKAAQITSDFMIIARVESLILEAGMDDALNRASAYVEAGADGIMIHSRQSSADEIREFVSRFRSRDTVTPLVVAPTAYNSVTVDEFADMGVNVVIYANHMLRAAYPSMMQVANSILQHRRSLEAEQDCMSINEILELIPGTRQ